MLNSSQLIKDLILLRGPSGQEEKVTEWVAGQVSALGFQYEIDPKGNLLVGIKGNAARPDVLVTAHLDEIAMIITAIQPDGKIRVAPVGGAFTFKWGEGPVEILTSTGVITGILSYGCIHTNSKYSVIEMARHEPYPWEHAYIFTGKSAEELASLGVRVGLRAVMAESRRIVTEIGDFIGSYFLDDRADIAVWLMALEWIKNNGADNFGIVTFAVTTSEEIGAEGAMYLLRRNPADICVALEIGPKTPEADFPIDSQPTIWVRDGYAAMESIDGSLLEARCEAIGIKPHWQYLSRGGSDASCSAAKGFTARPVTFGLPTENSHGYEIIHKDAPSEMLRLLMDYLQNV